MSKGLYEVTVYNIKGQQLATREIQHNGGTAAYTLPVDPSCANGIYTANIIDNGSKKETNIKLVISK